jgi:hypothetical protein
MYIFNQMNTAKVNIEMLFNQPSRVFMEISAVLDAVVHMHQLMMLMTVARNMMNATIDLDTLIVCAMGSLFSVSLQSEIFGQEKEELHGLFGGFSRQNMTWDVAISQKLTS